MTSGGWFAMALGSILFGSLFAAMQLSLRETSRGAIEDRARRRANKKLNARIEQIVEDIDGHALSLALPRMLFVLLFVVATVEWLAALTPASAAATWGEIVLGVALSAVLAWAMAGVVALSIARHAGAPVVCAMSRFIRAVHLLLAPSRRLSAFLDEVVRRLAGSDGSGSAERLEDEIRSVAEEGEREGHLDEFAGDMLAKVVEFGGLTVEETMTPRTEIQALEHTDELSEVKRFVIECGHSRIPVYREDLDHIVGILYAKDLLNWLCTHESNDSFSLDEILRKATFVPETKTVSELLKELLAERVHLAIAADEYGGTAGLVTIEDIIEEIFGEIEDEYETDDDERPSVDIDSEAMSAEVDARKHIDDANDQLEKIGIELPESEDYDTVGGFIVMAMGHIPVAGETLEHEELLISVLEAEATRVRRVRIERMDRKDMTGGARASEASTTVER